MTRIGRILHDYRDAGSVNGLLALWGFVDDTTFLTKAGHVGVVYRLPFEYLASDLHSKQIFLLELELLRLIGKYS